MSRGTEVKIVLENPIVMINTVINEFQLNIRLFNRITFITGDSGIGKSFLYDQLSLLSTEDEYKFIKCFNYLSPDVETQIESVSKNKDNLIVIDNFETLWSKNLTNIILSSPSRFALISRDFFGLMQSPNSVAELDVDNGSIGLAYPMPVG